MKYVIPMIVSRIFSLPAVSQYILDGQQLSVMSGFGFCGEALNPNQAVFCLNGSEDISAQLAGLTVNATLDGAVILVSCTASSESFCSGLVYTCDIQGQFSDPQCITGISNGSEIVQCSANTCTPSPL